MTKTEVESAIKVVINDVIDECYRYSSLVPGKQRERVFKIVNAAELLMDELISEVHEVQQIGGYSSDNPKIDEIKKKLNKKSLDYLIELRKL